MVAAKSQGDSIPGRKCTHYTRAWNSWVSPRPSSEPRSATGTHGHGHLDPTGRHRLGVGRSRIGHESATLSPHSVCRRTRCSCRWLCRNSGSGFRHHPELVLVDALIPYPALTAGFESPASASRSCLPWHTASLHDQVHCLSHHHTACDPPANWECHQ